jgi:hypothetical protein
VHDSVTDLLSSCERQQAWLPESPYTIDTALVPRGGHRRRKSMEPRSIQNLNGTLSILPASSGTPRSVSASYAVSPTKEFLNLPNSPGASSRSARRKSTLWVRSPSSDGDATDDAAAGLMLSPVPATPAPEVISAYADHILDNATPGGVTPYFLRREELVQRTCPPKAGLGGGEGLEGLQFVEGGGDSSGGATGSGVLMQRLLLARRKSLQWAPKVGSPLAKGGFGA